jgi:hypothetical protein
MKKQVYSKVGITMLICVITLAGIAPVSIVAAAAEVTAAPNPSVSYHERDYFRFEHALQRMELLLEGQNTHLDLANLSIAQTQDLIAKLQAEGKDTRDLEAVLSTFQGQVPTAQGAHDNAQTLIDAKAGFDANGKIVDEEQAKQTLQDAREAMKECRDIIQPAAQAFREAVKAYLQSLRPTDKTGELNLDIVG